MSLRLRPLDTKLANKSLAGATYREGSAELECSTGVLSESLSDCENPRFTERTSTNLGRSHRLPHVCTIMIYGKLGGYRLQETAAFIYTYIYM